METVNGGDFDKGVPPPPSPLTGCYLLIVVGEPHSQEHKDIILQRIAKGLLSWNAKDCLVDLEKELTVISEQALEGEEARYGERLIQFASENLVTEILIHPAVSTLVQCMRNLLSSFTRHRHIIHAGYTFAANGSWALQDGTFSYADFSEAFQEIETQRVIHAYENGISLDLHCSSEGDWGRLPKESFCRGCNVRVNPSDVLTCGSPSITRYISYISQFLIPTSLDELLQCSDVVGNIRFSRPTLYVFPGGQGDAALFGINGFNMLLDGGFSRKACFWDFVRHLDRLDAVLMTRLNNSNIGGISSIIRRKRKDAVYPQIGHFFCNIQERKTALSPDGDKDRDPLLIDLLDEGQEIISNLRHLNLNPQVCYRDSEPINLYHKVGHGTLNMYVLNPAKDSKEVKEFLQKWNQSDQKLFSKQHREISFPLQNLISVAVLLIWQPANANDTITRILYPGSSPQHKIFEGLDRVKNLEFIKHPVCSEKSLLAKFGTKKSAKDDKILPREKPAEKKEKMIIDNNINADIKEKQVKKADTVDADRTKAKKFEKPDIKSFKMKNDIQQRKKSVEKKDSPTTPKKNLDQAEPKKTITSTPAKSTKDANNRKVIENKTKSLKSAVEPKPKVERKMISRKPRTLPKAPVSPAKRVMNGVGRADGISKKGKIPDGTDSSTVSTPSADQESLKKDIANLTAEEIQQLKAEELAELEEEQEAVKEIEEVFRKGETRPVEDASMRKIKSISIEEDKSEKEEYLIIEKEDIRTDIIDEKEAKESEFQKLTRDSEESEKPGHVVSEDKLQKQEIVEEPKEIAPLKESAVAASEETVVTSQEEKIDVLSSDKKSDRDVEVKDIVESQPDEKVSANIKSGDTTTAPTLPEDERIPLDEIKEDNGYPIEEKYAKEETKEKGLPVIQLPPKTFDTIAKIPGVVGIRLDKQSHIRDIVKTPDEVADLPVHEEVDYEYAQESKTELKTNEIVHEQLKEDDEGQVIVKETEVDEEKEIKVEKEHIGEEAKEKEIDLKMSEEKVEKDKAHDVPVVEEVKAVEKIAEIPTEKEIIDVDKETKEDGKVSEEEKVEIDEHKEIKKSETELKEQKEEDVSGEDVGIIVKEVAHEVDEKEKKDEKLPFDTKDKNDDELEDKKKIEKIDSELPEKSDITVEQKEQHKIEDKEIKDDIEELPAKASSEKPDIGTKEEKLLQDDIDHKDKIQEPEIVTQIAKDVQLTSEKKDEQDKKEAHSIDDIKTEVPVKEVVDKVDKETKQEEIHPETKIEKEVTKSKETIEIEKFKLEGDKNITVADIEHKGEYKEEEIPKEKGTEKVDKEETKDKFSSEKDLKKDEEDIKHTQIESEMKDDESEEETSIKDQQIQEVQITKQVKDDVGLSTKEKDNKEDLKEKLSLEAKLESQTEVVEEINKSDILLDSAKPKEEFIVTEQKIEVEFPIVEKLKDDEEHAEKGAFDKPEKEIQQEKLTDEIEDSKEKESVYQLEGNKIKEEIDAVKHDIELKSTKEAKDDLKHVKEIEEEIEFIGPKQVPKLESHLQDVSQKEVDIKHEKEILEEAKESEIELDIDEDAKIREEKKPVVETLKESDKDVVIDKEQDISKKEVDESESSKEFKDVSSLPKDEKVEQKILETKAVLEELSDKGETSKDIDTDEKEEVTKIQLKSEVSEQKIDEIKHQISDLEHEKGSIEQAETKIEEKTKIESLETKLSTPEQKDSKRGSIVDGDEIKKALKGMELDERIPKDREECVIKIVASVAEVLKSDAPLEEFEGKLPISIETCKPTFMTELRETHITTMDDDGIDIKSSIISSVPEETSIASTIDEKDSSDSEISDLVKQSDDLMAASFIASTLDDAEEQVTVQRMLVTASSEDGGEEIEICPVGSITFSKSSESSGRSSPEKSLESKKSSIIDTISDSVATVKQMSEEHSDKDSDGTDVKSGIESQLISTSDFSHTKEALFDEISTPVIEKDPLEIEEPKLEAKPQITISDIAIDQHKVETLTDKMHGSTIDEVQEKTKDGAQEQDKIDSGKVKSEAEIDTTSQISVGKENESKVLTTDKEQDSDITVSSDPTDISMTVIEKKDSTEPIKPVDKVVIKESSTIEEHVSTIDIKSDKPDVTDKSKDLKDKEDKQKESPIDIKEVSVPASEVADVTEKKVEDAHDTEGDATTIDILSKVDIKEKIAEVTSPLKAFDSDVHAKEEILDLKDLSTSEKKEPINLDKVSETESGAEKTVESAIDTDKAITGSGSEESLFKPESDIEKSVLAEKYKSSDVPVKEDSPDLKDAIPAAEEKIESVFDLITSEKAGIAKDIVLDTISQPDEKLAVIDKSVLSSTEVCNKDVKDLPDVKDLVKPEPETKELSQTISESVSDNKIESILDTVKSKEDEIIKEEEKTDVDVTKYVEVTPDVKDLSKSLTEMKKSSDTISETATEKLESVSESRAPKEDDIVKDSLSKTDKDAQKPDVSDKSSTEVCHKESVKDLPVKEDLPKPISEIKEMMEKISEISTDKEAKSILHADTSKKVDITKEEEKIDVSSKEDTLDLKDLSTAVSEKDEGSEEKIGSASDSPKSKEEDIVIEGSIKGDSVDDISKPVVETKDLIEKTSETSTDKKIDLVLDQPKSKEDDATKAEEKPDIIDEAKFVSIEISAKKDEQNLADVKDILKSVPEVKDSGEKISEAITGKEIESISDKHKADEVSTAKGDTSKRGSIVDIPSLTTIDALRDTMDLSVSVIQEVDKVDEIIAKKPSDSVLDKDASKVDGKDSKLDDIPHISKTLDTDKYDISVEGKHDVSHPLVDGKEPSKIEKITEPEIESRTLKKDSEDPIPETIDKPEDIVGTISANEKDLEMSKDLSTTVVETIDSVSKINEIDKPKDHSTTSSKEDLCAIESKDDKSAVTEKSKDIDIITKGIDVAVEATKELSHSVMEEKESSGKSSEPVTGKILDSDFDKVSVKDDLDEKLEKAKSVKESDILSEKTSLTDQVSDTLSSTLSSDSSSEEKSSMEGREIIESITSGSISSDSVLQKLTEPDTIVKTEAELKKSEIQITSSVIDEKDIKLEEVVGKTEQFSDVSLTKKDLPPVELQPLKTDATGLLTETSQSDIKEHDIKDSTISGLDKDVLATTTSEKDNTKTEDKLEKVDLTKDFSLPKSIVVEEKTSADKDKSIKTDGLHDFHTEASLSNKFDDIEIDSSSFNGYGTQYDELHKVKDLDYTSSVDKSMSTSIYGKADMEKLEKDIESLKSVKLLPPHTEIGMFIESERRASEVSDHKKDITIVEPVKTTVDLAKDFVETSTSGAIILDKDMGSTSDMGEDYKKDLFHDMYSASGGITPPTAPVSPAVSEIYSGDIKDSIKETEKILSSDHDKIECTTSDSTTEDIYTMLRNKKMMAGDGLMSESFYGVLPDQISIGSEETQSEASYLFEVTSAKYVSQYPGDKTDVEFEDNDKKETKESSTKDTTAPKDAKCDIDSKIDKSSTATEKWISEDCSKQEKGVDEGTESKSSSPSLLELAGPRSHLYELTKAKDFTKSTDVKESEVQIPSHSASGQSHSTKEEPDPIAPWGKPLGLPSPAPTSDNRGTPKKERKLPLNVSVKNKWNDDKKRSESPSKNKTKKVSPIFVDLTYVPHHGNSYYSYVDFFKTVRARYYVFSGIEPGREVYNALLEAKQTWENKDLEVTIIPTYDTDILGYWVSENEELLTKFKIDLSPSASRCTINLQDHETSCSAYRLEF